jgi:UDP-glucuronate 4-epimerase
LGKKVLVTGSAGFIGFHLILSLLKNNLEVIGIDNLNDYYEPQLKRDRLELLDKIQDGKNYQFIKMDLSDRPAMEKLFEDYQFDIVINLAAQAGVRHSIENPHAYVSSNLVGFVNVLEGCRRSKVKHLVYASSSSVYGLNTKQPFSTEDRTDYPISLYAATKKSNELMAHTYSHLFGMPTTGLRFFTVYGPMGRPDMAYYSFTKKILNGEVIDVYNGGEMLRDFTYIDDIVKGIETILSRAPVPQDLLGSGSKAPSKIYNIGNNQPTSLRRFISAIETACGKKAIENSLPMQAGDVPFTHADVGDFVSDFGFQSQTDVEYGISQFVAWYKNYYKNDLSL